MKKIFAILAIAMFSVNIANAQLDNILNQVATAATNQSSTSKTGSTLSTLVSVISSKLVPTTTQIVGTWSYSKPCVMFTSSNSLQQTAAALATSSVENKLQAYLAKVGIKKGNVNITFNADKSFSINYNSKKVATGTYTISGTTVTLTFKGKSTPCKLTPQLDNGTLCLVADATKLKTFLENICGKNSYLSTLTTLTKNMQGLMLGIRLSK